MNDTNYEGIAIIGMAGRFPGAESVDELWSNLLAARESISFFSDVDLAQSGLDTSGLKARRGYVPARGVLKDADCFDAAFFGIHPKEAEVMDPQQRVFLEACWTALERAGYAANQMRSTAGVFGGATFNTYYLHALHQRPDLIELVGSDLVMLGNEKDYLTTRVAYKLGLKGPALNVSTACSTSLVAVCQACQSLLTYQCDVALAGGVSVRVPQQSGYYYDEGNIGSSDGHTRTFDANATGTAFSNGVAVVVLKRLSDAVQDGDQIYAVIKGSALNNDGSQRVSFGAPGVEGQSEVIAMAHAVAGVNPETITYVEAHGTATPLGDPIEIAGLTKAFRLATNAKQFCALGSVKTNVGHLDAAAGVTGLIKTALALHNKIIPANLHFTKPNPKLDLENSPFYVNAALQEWKSKTGIPRRAGVSSFGTGGTNAHVVLEEAPELEPSGPSRAWQLLVLSAKTPEALNQATSNLANHLKRIDGGSLTGRQDLADTAFTLQTGRSEFMHRRIVACSSAADGASLLETVEPKRVFSHHKPLRQPPVVFMFPGQGAQYVGMGAELYRSEPVFRAEVDQCAELLRPILGTDLRTVIFPAAGLEKESSELLIQTRYTQPALFVIEYALAKLWISWGIQPAAMIGHSVGEYAAACLSGVFSLEDALSLVAHRGALVQAQPGGAMLAIRLPEKEVMPLLTPQLAVAAVNSPSLIVVAGPHEAIATLEDQLKSKGAAAKHLPTSHAFHSSMMDPVLVPFANFLQGVTLATPLIPYVSNVTAKWITPEQATAVDYWAGHVRQTVRFADGVAELMKEANNILLEVGPGQTLSTLARQHPAKSADQIVLASLPYAGGDEPRGILEALGRLWMAGVVIDWRGFYRGELRRRTVLPTYPFARTRYWPAPTPDATQSHSPLVPSIGADETNTAQPMPPAAVEIALVQTSMHPQTHPAVPRRERLLAAGRSLMQELSGYDLCGIDTSVSLLELGLDSLLLTQAAQLFQRKFGVSITFRQLMQELGSLDAIATHLDAILPQDAFAAPPSVAALGELPATTGNSQNPALEQLLKQQQQLTNQLLQLMGRQPVSDPAQPLAVPQVAQPSSAKPESKSHGPFKPIDRGAAMDLSAEQTAAIESLIARYTRRTAESRKLAAKNRVFLADPRSVSGFNKLWKEMVYPIATTRSEGSKVWDIDGNEYLDFVMGFGASMFGHRPPFVVKAVQEQLERGFEIGPIQPLAGEVAALVREFTGMQRVGFTNTGSEAVLAATRVARTVTGRDKIAVFAGAYHGIFDEVLFRPLTINGETRSVPIAPGIPETALAQVIVLEYGNPQSLEILAARGAEIAAVLVEPVQSRRLDLQPKEFLGELRRITEQTGSALIFDEVVTGFRVHPGGAQAHFGVRANLATYGKVIGGGLPIGVVAGDARFMDALDGGQWQYDDKSFPEVGVTFLAGTFVRHPLALAAAKAVLEHLKQSGPDLQRRLTERTSQLADQLRALIDEFHAPYHLTQFSSLIQLAIPPDQKLAGLIFYLLRERGIHIWENRAFIVTTAHSDADLTHLVKAVRESLMAMQADGFLSPPKDRLRKPPGVASPPAEAHMPKKGPDSPLSPGDASAAFPLTEAQKEIWLAAQMGGNSAVAYNESLKFQFRGPFDVEVFRTAVQQVVQRHRILLAKISADGQWQQVQNESSLDLPLLDFTGLTAENRETELAAVIEREVSEPFDLVAGPLVRVKIARLAIEEHVVVWTAHHIVCDGWSGGLLISEFGKSYSALKQGTKPDLEVPVPFQDYVSATTADNPAVRDAMDYWRNQFAELPPSLDLPTDRPRPLFRSAKASTAKRLLAEPIHRSLKRLAGQQRTTLVVLLMAALDTLIYRLTGQTDFVVGLGVAGQAMTGQKCLVGHCVNLLPIRSQLQPEATFEQTLSAKKNMILDACERHQSTLGSILQHLKVPRSMGRPPLVEVIFNVDWDPGTVKFECLEFRCDRNPKRALHFDLFLNVVENQNGLCIECDYNTDLFDDSTIERWLQHYETLLQGIAATPTDTLSKIPILSDAEHNQLTIEWNKTNSVFPGQDTLHGWFEDQVRRTPNANALTFGGRHLTYTQLNCRANQVAHHLRGLGVGPEVLVGLFVDRSPELVVGILAILKAGGAYLPIDPVYPKDRLAFVLEDARVSVLLAKTALAESLPRHEAKVVCLDSGGTLFEGQSDNNLSPTATPDDLAYVIYTSGSTGKPKGTMVTHRNVAHLMQATEPWYHFNEKDVWTLFHSHAFDFSVWELWGALLYGGRVVVVPYLTSRSPEDFYTLLVQERVTVLNQTPSAFLQLSEAEAKLGVSKNLALRYVIFGGEMLQIPSLKAWFDRHGDQTPTLVNMYGITETTVHVTYRQLSAADLNSASIVGIPIPGVQVYLLDAHQQPVPIGVTGEIYVGGAGVARGYLNREELTRQRFLSDVVAGKAGARLYRSGDLARFLPNRDIEYIGRSDNQVKIRGFRIELGEVESVLALHSAVKQCLVLTHDNAANETLLVAYIQPRAGAAPSVADLRAHVKTALPEYMVPSIFVLLEQWPLTSNGKIDRKALPSPDDRPIEIKKDFTAPRDPLEQMLVQVWSKVLKTKRVGLDDNFFDLGGHSLLAVRVITEIEKLSGKRLPLATLLQTPTVGALAEVLRTNDWKPSWSSLVPIRPGGSKPPLFLMHSHGGNVLEYYPLANRMEVDQPIYALQARGLDGHFVKGQSLEQMASAYLQELRSLQPAGPYFLGGFCFGGLLALEAAHQLSAAGEEVALLVMIQTAHAASDAFKPGSSAFRRWWYRSAKRIDLEREHLLYRGTDHIQERIRRIWDVVHARTAIIIDTLIGNGHHRHTRLSMPYILETLAIEHEKVFDEYKPRPYGGKAVIFRATKQLPGFLADPYLGWKNLMYGDLELCEVPGHQQNILIEPNVSILAEQLALRLRVCQQKYGAVARSLATTAP